LLPSAGRKTAVPTDDERISQEERHRIYLEEKERLELEEKAQPPEKKPKKIGCLSWILIIFITLIGLTVLVELLNKTGSQVTNAPQPIPSKQTKAGTDEDIQAMGKLGVLKKVDPNSNEAWVNESLWNAVDAPAKEGMSMSLAYYCARKKNSSAVWVEIKSYHSGKLIAKYSESSGFEAY
jgi:hypothetical protein